MEPKNTLHIINKSPNGSSAFSLCLASLGGGDGILLIEDGVYGASQLETMLNGSQHTGYIMTADAKARGLSDHPSVLQLIDYPQFVELCTQYQKSVSWF